MVSSAASAMARLAYSGAFIGSVPVMQASKWLMVPLSLSSHIRVFVPVCGFMFTW